MARKVALDTCMFCTPEVLCQIHAAKVKPTKPRKVIAQPVTKKKHECGWCTPEERAAGMPCACQDDATPITLASPPVVAPANAEALRAAMQRHARPTPPPAVAPVVEADSVMDDAIRALAPILHPTERFKYKDIIHSDSTVQARAAAWKQKVRGL